MAPPLLASPTNAGTMPSPGLISSAWKHGSTPFLLAIVMRHPVALRCAASFLPRSASCALSPQSFLIGHGAWRLFSHAPCSARCCFLHAQAGDDATGLPARPRAWCRFQKFGERDTRGLWAGPERRRKPPFGHHRCSFAHNPNAASATGLIRNRPPQGQVPRLLFITVADESIARDAEITGS